MSRFQLPTEIPPGGVMLEGRPYRLLAVLGSGGQGIAYKVQNLEAGGRFECMKILLNVHERELVDRFLRERDTLARIDHKAIVQLIGSFWLPDGRPAFTMPYVDGLSVKQMLAGGQPLSVRQAVTIASEVADGLAAAHAKGFVHRDIKPANIIVARDGAVKIIDFGVAKVLQTDPNSPEEKLTVHPGLIGTMAYASPEMLWRFVATPESDLYSLGLVLYEMLTGRRPFRAKSAVELAELMRTTSPPPLAAAGQGGPFPEQLDWIVRSLLKANVEERTRTAAEARRQLEMIKRLLPNDAQIEVSADALGDDVTVASTAVGTYRDAIAATGPAPAATPVLRVSDPSYPSSVPTAPSPTPANDDGTVQSHAFAARPPSQRAVASSRMPSSELATPHPDTPHAMGAVPSAAQGRRSLLPFAIIAAVLLGAAAIGAVALAMRRPENAAGVPAAPVAPTATASTASPNSSAVVSKETSTPPVQPEPTGAPPQVAAATSSVAPGGKKPVAATSAAAIAAAKSAPPVAAATTPTGAAPTPSVVAPPPAATTPAPAVAPPPAKPPPPGGAMDDRL